MPKCPKDGTLVDVEYGMVTCPTCGSILFVDMDGEAQIGTDSPAATSKPSSASSPLGSRLEDSPAESLASPVGLASPAHDEFVYDGDEGFGVGVPEASNEFLPPPIPAGQVPLGEENLVREDTPFDMDHLLGNSPAVEMGEEGSSSSTPAGSSAGRSSVADPLGLNAYANSEFSQAKDGLLLVRLYISGLDSKEVRQSLREAITDRRFAWEADDLLRKIKHGDLVLDNLSPVKATILINRIKCLPLKIRWEQYVVTQAETF